MGVNEVTRGGLALGGSMDDEDLGVCRLVDYGSNSETILCVVFPLWMLQHVGMAETRKGFMAFMRWACPAWTSDGERAYIMLRFLVNMTWYGIASDLLATASLTSEELWDLPKELGWSLR